MVTQNQFSNIRRELKKHISILNLVKTIQEDPDFSGVQIIDFKGADLCAIGFFRGDRLVYVNTFHNADGKGPDNFDMEKEIIDPQTFMPLKKYGMEESISFEALKVEMREHLFGQ